MIEEIFQCDNCGEIISDIEEAIKDDYSFLLFCSESCKDNYYDILGDQ